MQYINITAVARENIVSTSTIRTNLYNFIATTNSGATCYMSATTSNELLINKSIIDCITKREHTRLIINKAEVTPILQMIYNNERETKNYIQTFITVSPKDFNEVQLIHLISQVFEHIQSESTGATTLLFSFETNENVYTDMLHAHICTNALVDLTKAKRYIDRLIASTTKKGNYCNNTVDIQSYNRNKGNALGYTVKMMGTDREILTGVFLR